MEDETRLSLFFYFICGAIVKHLALSSIQRRRLNCLEYVGRLSKITLFPLKSGRGLNFQQGQCTRTGLGNESGSAMDRQWMVTTPDGVFVTGRQRPKLALVESSIQENDLQLKAPGMAPLTLPLHPPLEDSAVVKASVWNTAVEAADCGDKASTWISQYLGKPGLRVVFSSPELPNRKVNQCDTMHWYTAAKDDDEVAFQDGFPLMLISEGSLSDLNSKLSRDVRMDNFRPNLVITGCDPFDEDNWDTLHIGPVKFKNGKPCTRCIFTTVNPDTGEKDKDMEPLRTLRGYRLLFKEFGQDPCFGINLLVETPGLVRVGDPVYVTRK